MENASDTSAVFTSTISKEHDIFMGSVYSLFCESTQHFFYALSIFSTTQSPFLSQVYCPS